MSNPATELSSALGDAVATAGARVVRVEGRRRSPASGLIWDTGTIVTASHVVSSRRPSRIGWPDGSVTEAQVVGRDPATDVAVLSASGGGSSMPAEGPAVRVGELALAVARPGESLRSALGVITAHEGPWRTQYGTEVTAYLEAGLTMYPGFSGGALAGAGGEVLGMLTSTLLPGHAVAIPTATLGRIVGDLTAHGRIRRAYLGVGVQPAALPPAVAQTLGRDRGLLVSSVETGSPAEEAGVIVGDVLLALDGEPLSGLDDLLAALTGDRLDRTSGLDIVRGGEQRRLEVRLRERPDPSEAS